MVSGEFNHLLKPTYLARSFSHQREPFHPIMMRFCKTHGREVGALSASSTQHTRAVPDRTHLQTDTHTHTHTTHNTHTHTHTQPTQHNTRTHTTHTQHHTHTHTHTVHTHTTHGFRRLRTHTHTQTEITNACTYTYKVANRQTDRHTDRQRGRH